QDARSLAAERDDIRICLERATIGDYARDATAFEQQAFHGGVELEHNTAPTQELGERGRELVAVAGLVAGKMQTADQLHGGGPQRRLNRQNLLRVDHAVRDAELGEDARGFLHTGKLLLGAEELQHASFAVVEGDARVRNQLFEARLAVMSDALHARLVAREALGAAVTPEARQPGPLVGIEPRPQHDRRVARQQPACDLERQSRRCPWTGKSWADAAGIGEARLQCRAALAVDHDNLVSGPGEIVSAARS